MKQEGNQNWRADSPGLLISVSNAVEAGIACSHPIDILDAKDPNGGSLGRLAAAELQAILAIDSLPEIVSCALGELLDCVPAEVCQYIAQADLGGRLSYVKAGLAGASHCSSDRGCDWRSDWLALNDCLPNHIGLVVVAYADYALCDCPSVREVLEFAIATGDANNGPPIFLIDTKMKNGNNLFDHLTLEELHSIREITRGHGIRFSIAGSLGVAQLQAAGAVAADYFAVRGAVCESQQRQAAITENSMRDFYHHFCTATKKLCR